MTNNFNRRPGGPDPHAISRRSVILGAAGIATGAGLGAFLDNGSSADGAGLPNAAVRTATLSVANAPVDPLATANTKALLDFLYGLWVSRATTARTLTGAFIGGGKHRLSNKSVEWDQYQPTTGQIPAIMGVSDLFAQTLTYDSNGVPLFDWTQGGTDSNDPGYLQMLIDHAVAGGIPVVTFLPNNPSPPDSNCNYPNGTTVSSVNATGTLSVTNSGTFPKKGSGQVWAGSSYRSMTWDGLDANNNLLGVVVADTQLPDQIAQWANVRAVPSNSNPLAAYASSLNSWDVAGETMLIWSKTAGTTLKVGNLKGQSQANINLNTMLDTIAVLAAGLQAHDIPFIFRPWAEDNNATGLMWWSNGGNPSGNWQQFTKDLWKYTIGYLTGSNGFPNQPVTGIPVHNALFAYAQTVPNPRVGRTPPAMIDLYGLDQYDYMDTIQTRPPSYVVPDFLALAALPGFANVPQAFCEAFAGPSSGTGSGSVIFQQLDLSTLTGSDNSTLAAVSRTPPKTVPPAPPIFTNPLIGKVGVIAVKLVDHDYPR